MKSASNGDFSKVVAFIEVKKENPNLENDKGETEMCVTKRVVVWKGTNWKAAFLIQKLFLKVW